MHETEPIGLVLRWPLKIKNKNKKQKKKRLYVYVLNFVKTSPSPHVHVIRLLRHGSCLPKTSSI